MIVKFVVGLYYLVDGGDGDFFYWYLYECFVEVWVKDVIYFVEIG